MKQTERAKIEKRKLYYSRKNKGLCVYCGLRKTIWSKIGKKRKISSCSVCILKKWHPNIEYKRTKKERMLRVFGKTKIVEKIR